jgi:aspartyl/asparaginyl-tRNA synthetase
MPYEARSGGQIDYTGNKIFESRTDIGAEDAGLDSIPNRITDLHDDEMWSHLAAINNYVYEATVEYFSSRGAIYTLLPLTTRMISSPGAVFGSEALDYTEDTSPVKLEWFDLGDQVFLSESSQIYLELALIQQDVDEVYSIYNSFRKEEADLTHLSEFHHIEYEGTVTQEQNEAVIEELLNAILDTVLTDGREHLSYFLPDSEIERLQRIRDNPPKTLTFREALDLLDEETGDQDYLEFTEAHFDDWEEIKESGMFEDRLLKIVEYPLLEVPFYHAPTTDEEGRDVAINADYIWPNYKETVGSGQRVESVEAVEEKSEVFNLPEEDYEPYLQSRQFDSYETTSGFGVGWERLVQGMLQLPNIASTAHFPRTHESIKP